MQSVRKFDKNHTDVLGHGKKHLAQVLRLHLQFFIRLMGSGGKGDFLQFRDPMEK